MLTGPVLFRIKNLTVADVRSGFFVDGIELFGYRRSDGVIEVTYGENKKHLFYEDQCYDVRPITPQTAQENPTQEDSSPTSNNNKPEEGEDVEFELQNLERECPDLGFVNGATVTGKKYSYGITVEKDGEKYLFQKHHTKNLSPVPNNGTNGSGYTTAFGDKLVEGDLVTFQVCDLTEFDKFLGFSEMQILSGYFTGMGFKTEFNGSIVSFSPTQVLNVVKRKAIAPEICGAETIKGLEGIRFEEAGPVGFLGKPCAFEDLLTNGHPIKGWVDESALKVSVPENFGSIQLDTKKVMDVVKEGSPSVTQDEYDRQLVVDLINKLRPTHVVGSIDTEVLEEFLRERAYKRNRIKILEGEIQEKMVELEKLRGGGE